MLILTRKRNESVVVANAIRITVVEISPGQVRLGFEAPADVSIYREELYRVIAEANRAAVERREPAPPAGDP